MEHPDLPLMRRMADAVAGIVEASDPADFGRVLRMGADGTPTKHVDAIAEQAIIDLLPAKGIDLLSEECGFLDRGGDRVFVVDPIDGTTNASRGIPFYCVSLAVGRKTLGDVEAGIVVNLCTGDRFEAVRGQGAALNGRAIRTRADPKGGRVYATSGMLPEDAPAGHGVLRSFGASALEMCLVGQGAIEGYHYAKPILRIIDIAASSLIVREAGGLVLDAKGKDLELPLSLEPRFGLTAAANADIAKQMGVL